MTEDDQIALRNEVLSHAFGALEKEKDQIGTAIVRVATALIGASAVVIAVCPKKETREELAAALINHLLASIEKRAGEIRSGAFDDALNRWRQ